MLAISRWFKTDTWLSLSAVAFLGISTLSGAHYAGDPDCQAPCPDKCRLVGDLPVVENEGSSCVDAVIEYGRKEDGCCDSAVGATNPCRSCFARVRMYLRGTVSCIGVQTFEGAPAATKNICAGQTPQAVEQSGNLVLTAPVPPPSDPTTMISSATRIVDIWGLKCGCQATASLTIIGTSPVERTSVSMTCNECGQ
jgi:hypothetical protein